MRVAAVDTLAATGREVGLPSSRVYLYSGARMDELDEPGECGRIGGRKHAVTEVEDVAGPPARAGEHVGGTGLDALPRAEERSRVEVALDAAVGARRLPACI